MSEVNGMKCDGTGVFCGSPGCCPKAASPVQGAASASGAKGAAVKPWQERFPETYPNYPLDKLSAQDKIGWLEAEIADWRAWGERIAAKPEAQDLTPLDYRAQGREEALAIILAEDPENPFADHMNSVFGGEDYSTEWDKRALRDLLHIEDRKHDAYDRAEAAYWQALGEKEEAEREMNLVKRAPYYKPLHDFLAEHEAWDLMADLKRATPAAQEGAAPAAERAIPELEPVTGDQLPPVGAKVLIHLARQDEWVEHTVVGYYAWKDLGGDANLHRVFVRVVDANGYENARLLCDVRSAAPTSTASAPDFCDLNCAALEGHHPRCPDFDGTASDSQAPDNGGGA